MQIAIKLKAENDVDGNPRRGWLVYAIPRDVGEPECIGWVEEGYGGDQALEDEYPDARTVCALSVPVSEYETARSDD